MKKDLTLSAKILKLTHWGNVESMSFTDSFAFGLSQQK